MKEQKPTHWMDAITGKAVSDKFMRSDRAHSDYQMAYTIPCVMKNGKLVKLESKPANT